MPDIIEPQVQLGGGIRKRAVRQAGILPGQGNEVIDDGCPFNVVHREDIHYKGSDLYRGRS